MKRKVVTVALLALGLASITEAKVMWPGEIAGRDLNIPGLGWAGHVGITTGDLPTEPANEIIEVLNPESPNDDVILISIYRSFRSKSPYWGSRYGLGDHGDKMHQGLIQANHQRWWKAYYTIGAHYDVGYGNVKTGESYHKGTWRCDTFAAWTFTQAADFRLMNLNTLIPRTVFNAFPYRNTNFKADFTNDIPKAPMMTAMDIAFESLSADEINLMQLEELQMIADIPFNQETPTHIAAEWKAAKNPVVDNVKRGLFIFRMSMIKDSKTIPEFIKMYNKETDPEIKSKLMQGIITYFEKHVDRKKESPERTLLQDFFKKLLINTAASEDYEDIVRGYIELNTPSEILKNVAPIKRALSLTSPNKAITNDIILMHKSKELEKIFVIETIELLKNAKSSNLDEMFFGTTKMGIKSFVDPNTIPAIKDYMNFVKSKYSSPALLHDDKDPMASMARGALRDLENDPAMQ